MRWLFNVWPQYHLAPQKLQAAEDITVHCKNAITHWLHGGAPIAEFSKHETWRVEAVYILSRWQLREHAYHNTSSEAIESYWIHHLDITQAKGNTNFLSYVARNEILPNLHSNIPTC